MNRRTFTVLTLAAVVALGAGAAAQQPKPAAQAPKPATSAPAAPAGQTPVAPRRLIAPVRGVAQIGYTKPVVKRDKVNGRDFIVTTMQIKNMAAGPIAGLKVDDFWYDKGGNPLPADSYRHPKPLMPGEIITVRLETPVDPRMNRNQWQFSHANGEIKPTLVPKM